MNIVILGGGITGQLAKLVFGDEAEVFDSVLGPRPLTRSFGANYLYERVGEDLGLKHREFRVSTTIDGTEATIDSIARYKRKVGKEYELIMCSPSELNQQFRPHTTGYDFVDFPTVPVHYNWRMESIDIDKRVITFVGGSTAPYQYLFSTIPLPFLLKALTSPKVIPEGVLNLPMKYSPIYVCREPNPTASSPNIAVNYVSLAMYPYYRWCDRDGFRHYESIVPLTDVKVDTIYPGKIHDPSIYHRKQVMQYLRTFHIHCFGRFASWRSNELVHHTYHQLHATREWIQLQKEGAR